MYFVFHCILLIPSNLLMFKPLFSNLVHAVALTKKELIFSKMEFLIPSEFHHQSWLLGLLGGLCVTTGATMVAKFNQASSSVQP